MALQNKSHGGDDSVCACLRVCHQQSAMFFSISSVNQPKENWAECDTPQIASCLGAWGVFHPDWVFPPPTYSCTQPHAMFKTYKSLLIKTTAKAGGFRRRSPKPPCRRWHTASTPTAILPFSTVCIILILVAAFRRPRHRLCCARVNYQRENEPSCSWSLKCGKSDAQKKDPSLDWTERTELHLCDRLALCRNRKNLDTIDLLSAQRDFFFTFMKRPRLQQSNKVNKAFKKTWQKSSLFRFYESEVEAWVQHHQDFCFSPSVIFTLRICCILQLQPSRHD